MTDPRFVLLLCLAAAGCASETPPPRSAPPAEPAVAARARQDWAPDPDRYIATERRQQTMRINVDVSDQDLAEVCERIGRLVGRTLIVDPDVQETVTVDLQEIPWREAVSLLAKMTRCEVEERDRVLRLFQRPEVHLTGSGSAKTLLESLAAFAGREIRLPPGLEVPLLFQGVGRPVDLMRGILEEARLPYDVVWGDPIRLQPRPVELTPRLQELR